MSLPSTYYQRLKQSLLNNRIVAPVVFFSTVIIAIASFTDGISQLGHFFGFYGKATPDLAIIDVDSSEANSIEFKLKNSGDDTGFLTRIVFFVDTGTKICIDCEQEVEFDASSNEHGNEPMDILQITPVYRGVEYEPFSIGAYWGFPGAIYDPIDEYYPADLRTDPEILEVITITSDSPAMSLMEQLRLRLSTTFRISQSIAPKGVDSFRIKFDAEELDERIYYTFTAFAEIIYDGGEHIRTRPFEIYLQQCMPNKQFQPTRCPRD
jgi:hypothetical protein